MLEKLIKIIQLSILVVLVFKSSEGSTMLARPIRTESDIKAGAGSFIILHATGVFKNIYNINVNMQYQLQTLELLYKKIYVKRINYFKFIN